MSEFPSTAGGGAWMTSHGGGPPTPAPSPNPVNVMRAMPSNTETPFNCGICYDYLSSNVDELDEHIMKHKRELAERVAAQNPAMPDHVEASYMSRNHQSMVYYGSPTDGASQTQAYEYAAQSCSGSQQIPQFRESQDKHLPHSQLQVTYSTAEKYYANHPALLPSPNQPQSSSLATLYANESLNRSAGSLGSGLMQHEDFGQTPTKRCRVESHPYERDTNNYQHAGAPDLSEDNTADADPAADQMRDEADRGPVSFSEAQSSDSVIFHELQPLKSENAAATRSDHRNICGTASAGFDAKEGAASSAQESHSAAASESHENSAKRSSIPSSKDSTENDFEAELASTTAGSSGDGNARSDTESTRGHGAHKAKGDHPRRRSCRTLHSRR